jgi:hypothetical protein
LAGENITKPIRDVLKHPRRPSAGTFSGFLRRRAAASVSAPNHSRSRGAALSKRASPPSRVSTPRTSTELLGHTGVLVEEKHFEGAGGLVIRDELRLTIAAQAALLLLHRDTDYFPGLTSVSVYPTGYVASDDGRHHAQPLGEHIDHDLGSTVRAAPGWKPRPMIAAMVSRRAKQPLLGGRVLRLIGENAGA